MLLLWEGTNLQSISTDYLKAIAFGSPSTSDPTFRVVFYLDNGTTQTAKTWDFTEANAAKLAYKNVVKTLINLGLAVDCGKPESILKRRTNGTMVQVLNI